MSTLTVAMFTFPLGTDAALIPRTPAIAEAFHELLVANHQRLIRWDPGACPDPLTLANTRSRLQRNAQAWLEGSQVPVAIAVPQQGGWRLVGAANLRLNGHHRSGEIGYWIDAGHEGRGLVTRTVTAMLDHGFGALGLHRVTLATDAGNHRGRALAHRLGFTRDAILPEAFHTPDGPSDEFTYSLLATDWHAGGRVAACRLNLDKNRGR